MSNRKIFLLAGQSNMQGCGNFGDHPRMTDERIFNFKDASWDIAAEPLHEWTCKLWPDGGVGLAMSFGLALLEKYPQWEIGFVPCAFSGSPLERWQPGADLYEEAVVKVKQALKACDGELAGVLWHQGEADSKNKEMAETYASRFQKTVAGFRNEFMVPNLPVIAGELGRFLINDSAQFPFYQIINNALEQVATAVVSSEGLTCKDRSDNTHFDTASLREFGIRYAQKYLALLTQ